MTAVARPPAVRWAEWLGLASALLGAVREALLWNERVALDGTALTIVFTFLVPVFIALLVLAVTRWRSKSAFVVLVLLLALSWLTTARLGLTNWSAAYNAGAASLLLQTAGLLLMITPRAFRWLWGRG